MELFQYFKSLGLEPNVPFTKGIITDYKGDKVNTTFIDFQLDDVVIRLASGVRDQSENALSTIVRYTFLHEVTKLKKHQQKVATSSIFSRNDSEGFEMNNTTYSCDQLLITADSVYLLPQEVLSNLKQMAELEKLAKKSYTDTNSLANSQLLDDLNLETLVTWNHLIKDKPQNNLITKLLELGASFVEPLKFNQDRAKASGYMVGGSSCLELDGVEYRFKMWHHHYGGEFTEDDALENMTLSIVTFEKDAYDKIVPMQPSNDKLGFDANWHTVTSDKHIFFHPFGWANLNEEMQQVSKMLRSELQVYGLRDDLEIKLKQFGFIRLL